jgi:hypothetical protein
VISKSLTGWKKLVEGYPRFVKEKGFSIPAYSEFMPPPRVGLSPYGEIDPLLFSGEDPYGWQISEIEEEYELKPGLENIARQILPQLVKLGRALPAPHIAGHNGRNLQNNLYWPTELAARAGHLDYERYVTFLPLALSRTQDEMGRVRWTILGSSEQGPERPFWKGFYSAPGQELPEQESLSFIFNLLARVYGEKVDHPEELGKIGFRILPSGKADRFPHWDEAPLPSWSRTYLIQDQVSLDKVRYLLTFRPFSRLPAPIKEKYFAGNMALLPFPGSLIFWGMPSYLRLQEQLPMGLQMPLLRLIARHEGPWGIRVPQSGWLHEPRRDQKDAVIQEELLLNTYRRTHRWNRVYRHEDSVAQSTRIDKVTQALFSTALDSLELYNKPMARNCQIWTEDVQLLLNGPKASRKEIERAAAAVLAGGLFRYRFQFPPMQVGLYEVCWQRPLVAYFSKETGQAELLPDAPLGYLAAYKAHSPDVPHPVELWPKLLRRRVYLSALHNFDSNHDHYRHQTSLNILRLLESWQILGKRPLPRSFVRQLIDVPKEESLDQWLNKLPERAGHPTEGRRMQQEVKELLEPKEKEQPLPEDITFQATATRPFEQAFWQDILTLAHGRYINKDNADTVLDPVTQNLLRHPRRDLEELGDYLIRRHRQAIATAGLEGKAFCGELPFRWQTDFDFSLFGGWKINQEEKGHERNILVVIPGKNRKEAVVMADHYDTAYMEDVYEKSHGGSGARLAAAGADDNHSATATLLQAAPVFSKLAKEGRLERDIWLLHLTGEEFPSDCLGARHFCQSLVEKTLEMRLNHDRSMDLSMVRVVGVFVLDMIAHNRDNAKNIFQISPGKSPHSLRLAWEAHVANLIWNAKTGEWNRSPERQGKGHGKRSMDGKSIPDIAPHPQLEGEVRTTNNPHSSLYNTDGQIFSDVGVPVVLFMENYDINRTGYHDTKDIMANIDLDYGAAVAAIATETVARVATSQEKQEGKKE